MSQGLSPPWESSQYLCCDVGMSYSRICRLSGVEVPWHPPPSLAPKQAHFSNHCVSHNVLKRKLQNYLEIHREREVLTSLSFRHGHKSETHELFPTSTQVFLQEFGNGERKANI